MPKITIFRHIKHTEDTTVTPIYTNIEVIVDRLKQFDTIAYLWDKDEKGKPMHPPKEILKGVLIDRIRTSEAKSEANELKYGLPSILFAGEFPHRKRGAMPITHSGYIILDIDELGDYTMDTLRAVLQGDHYTLCAFVSPSGAGFKVVVKIPADISRHIGYYLGLEHYYKHTYNIKLDPSGKNIGRVCYESYDPNVYYNPDSLQFTHCVETARDTAHKTNSRLSEVLAVSSDETIKRVLKWWERNYSMSNGRNQTLFVLAAALNRYGVSEMEAKNVCYYYEDSRSGDPFTRKEIDGILRNAYSNTADHATEIFEDNERKRDLYKMVGSADEIEGVENLREYEELAKLSTSELVELFYEVKEDAKKKTSNRLFWYYDDGRLKIDNNDMLQFINELGYYVYKRSNAVNDYALIHIDNNILRVVDEVEIKHRVMEFVLSKNENIVFNKITDTTKYFSMGFLSGLPIIVPPILRDKRDVSYFPTPSGVFKVSSAGVTKIDYIDLTDGYVWESQITEKDFAYIPSNDYTNGDFYKFARNIAGSDDYRHNQLMRILGFLMHNYKDPSITKAVVLYDANRDQVDGTPEGGSGKSMLFEGICKVRDVARITGDRIDFKRQFALQEISESSQIAWIDETDKDFDLKPFFSRISNGLTLEKKGKDPIYLRQEESPKFGIATNNKPKGVGGSFARRLMLFAVSNHYSEHHTPIMEFGRAFFQDWDKLEWDRFFSYLANCVYFYLSQGLPKDIDNDDRDLTIISECGNTFYDYWIRDGAWEKGLASGGIWVESEYSAYSLNDTDTNKSRGYKRFRANLGKLIKIMGCSGVESGKKGSIYLMIKK